MPRATKRDRERLLMRLHEHDATLQTKSLFEIADGIGLPRETARAAAEHLQERGFLHLTNPSYYDELKEPSRNTDCEVAITALGVEEVERLGLPFWRQVFDARFVASLVLGVILSVVSAAVTVFVVETLKHRLWP